MFRFLAEFSEIDLVLAGHSHEEEPGRGISGAWFVQAGRYAGCFARITAEFDDRNGRLLRIRSELVRPDPSQPPDAGTTRVLEPFLRAYRPVAEKVLAGEVTHCPHGRPVMTVFTYLRWLQNCPMPRMISRWKAFS